METLRSISRRFWGPSPTPGPSPSPARPFWLRPGGGEGRPRGGEGRPRGGEGRPRGGEGRPRGGEGRPRGVLAASLDELREQACSVLGVSPPVSLAVAQDGTLVENEEFLGSLPPHTELQVLGPGQRWEPPKAPPSWELSVPPEGPPNPEGPPEVARLSLLVAQGDPRGRLRVAAQIRGVRWDLGALGPERVFRELLRVLTALTRALGQALLGVSGALRPLLEGPPEPRAGH